MEDGALIVRGGDGAELVVPESWLADDFTGAWRWEIDGPRRVGVSTATQIDLRMLPDQITLGQLATAIERCKATDGDYTAVVLSAWQAVGQPAVGEALVAFASSEEGNCLILAAKANVDKGAIGEALRAINTLRKAGAR